MEENNLPEKNLKPQSSSIWMGLIFIFGGAIVFLNQLDILPFELNWWALFILMPAAGFLTNAYNSYQKNQRKFTTDVLYSGLIGLFIVFIALSLLLGSNWNINWGMLWPLILIVVGIGILVNRD